MKYVGIILIDAEFYGFDENLHYIVTKEGIEEGPKSFVFSKSVFENHCKDLYTHQLTFEMAYYLMKLGYFVGRKKWNGDFLRITNSRIKKCLVDTSRLWIDYVPLNQDQLTNDWGVIK